MKDGRIENVGDRSLLSGFSGDEIVAFPDAALLPALVNPHTHLEFSGCSTPLGEPGDSFAAWLHQVISRRRESFAVETDELRAQRRRESVASGVAESRAASVAAVGDIATPGWPADVLPSADELQIVVFLEMLGLRPDRVATLQAAAREHVMNASGRNGDEPRIEMSGQGPAATVSTATRYSLIRGLSPHAPYTVSPDLVAWAASLSAETNAPLAMHLAESFDEYELISAHSGQLVDVLREFEAWNPAAVPRGIRWRDYLELLAHAARALVVHGNLLGPDDWRILADQRETMSVVYCPRTHARFRHGAYPLAEMLAAGVRVTVGTDSRATNPDLQ
ncbi:MAG TPA: amidohydrolase family protein, partial [Pirellulaceae bacterium]|nr:amidohydrolase family protein [Pirellulaceae bacterium]